MTNNKSYTPANAFGAEVQKGGDEWTLILVRTLKQPPAKVWKALTEPEQLREWAPFDSDRKLDTIGTATLTTVGAPLPNTTVTTVKHADAPNALEYTWGGNNIRWELEPAGDGTRLTLWHNIGRNYIAMGAAGWHICLDVLDHFLGDAPVGRMVGPEMMKFEGWQRLFGQYSKQFSVEPPSWQTGQG